MKISSPCCLSISSSERCAFISSTRSASDFFQYRWDLLRAALTSFSVSALVLASSTRVERRCRFETDSDIEDATVSSDAKDQWLFQFWGESLVAWGSCAWSGSCLKSVVIQERCGSLSSDMCEVTLTSPYCVVSSCDFVGICLTDSNSLRLEILYVWMLVVISSKSLVNNTSIRASDPHPPTSAHPQSCHEDH